MPARRPGLAQRRQLRADAAPVGGASAGMVEIALQILDRLGGQAELRQRQAALAPAGPVLRLKRDLPVLLEEARAAHPGCEITLATAAGEADPVVAAMADYALGCLG